MFIHFVYILEVYNCYIYCYIVNNFYRAMSEHGPSCSRRERWYNINEAHILLENLPDNLSDEESDSDEEYIQCDPKSSTTQ